VDSFLHALADEPALDWSDVDRQAVDLMRVLAMDAIELSCGHSSLTLYIQPYLSGRAGRPDQDGQSEPVSVTAHEWERLT
jgi:hypothetical protein